MARKGMKAQARSTVGDGAARVPVNGRPAQSPPEPQRSGPWLDHARIFAGPRPASARRGLEPAFLLFETEVMEALHARAARRGLGYDTLVRMIVRDHVGEY